jgi:hypothetical protein
VVNLDADSALDVGLGDQAALDVLAFAAAQVDRDRALVT